MTRSSRSTKFMLIALISSLAVASCGASRYLVSFDDMDLRLVPQKSSRLKKAARIVGGLFWSVAAGVSFFAIVDAFMNNARNSSLIQGGAGATALLVSLYKLGFFEAGNDSYDDYHHECGCGCHDSCDSYHDCSCYDGSCCNHAFCYDHYEREDTYEQESDNTEQIHIVTVETVSNDVMCNEVLTDFWEDPFNY